MNTNKAKSKKQEMSVAKEIGGKTTIASGALWINTADVRNDKVLVECKITSKPYYCLSNDTWYKIATEATKDGLRVPLMCIDLEDGKQRYAVLRVEDTGNIHYANTFNPEEFYGGVAIEKKIDQYGRTHTIPVIGMSKYSHRISHRGILKMQIRKGVIRQAVLCVIPWEEFIEKVLPNYEKE